MKYIIALSVLFCSQIASAAWLDSIIPKTTLMIATEYGRSGATCFLVEGDHERVYIVTCKHVVYDVTHQTMDVFNFFNRGDAIRNGSKIFRIPINAGQKPLWVSSPCGDIAVFDSCMTASMWKSELNVPILPQISDLMSIREVEQTTHRTFFAYGYPKDASGLLMDNQKSIKFTNLQRIRLAPRQKGDDCGYIYDGNYKILHSIGGLSGSPVYNEDGIAGVVSGVPVYEFKTTFVPAEYVVLAILTLQQRETP